MKQLSRLGARLVRATYLFDRAYLAFDRLRGVVVTAFASDELLSAYNDLTYSASQTYDAGTDHFREVLFNWEADLIERVFPKPPCRVLVGGAGGGREAFQLASMGYDVTAFEPSLKLARSMQERAERTGLAVTALWGGYEDTPMLRKAHSGDRYDLSRVPRFDAGLLGWTSLSHLRTPHLRGDTLRSFAELTDGPVVASFFLRPSAKAPRPRVRRFFDTLGRRSEGDAFTAHIGYYHLSSREELEAEIAAAGLQLVDASYDGLDGRWPWVAVAQPQIAARLGAASRPG